MLHAVSKEVLPVGENFGKPLEHEDYTNSHSGVGQRHVNRSPIDHPYKCHENTNHSRVPQLSKAPIPTSK